MELTPLEQQTLDSIKEIQAIKQEGKVIPDMATLLEIENSFRIEIKEAINSLYRKGLIVWHKNVNGIPMSE